VAIQLVFETHSPTVDNEQGRCVATGSGCTTLEDLLEQDFAWQEGWEYRLG
jgi:hypothetical protein